MRIVSLAMLFTAASAGCGGEAPPDLPTAHLAGSVTISKKPIADGRIQFIPLGQGQASPDSVEIKQGRYDALKVPRGKVRVMFQATRATGKMDDNYSKPFPEVVSIIPAEFADGIELEVTGDRTDQDFDLSNPSPENKQP